LLIADFEALREQLETASWALLGHSDGDGYALQYVTSHPEAVRALDRLERLADAALYLTNPAMALVRSPPRMQRSRVHCFRSVSRVAG
jgi:pimeloyl-ACP methyl ester carboxylesterase